MNTETIELIQLNKFIIALKTKYNTAEIYLFWVNGVYWIVHNLVELEDNTDYLAFTGTILRKILYSHRIFNAVLVERENPTWFLR